MSRLAALSHMTFEPKESVKEEPFESKAEEAVESPAEEKREEASEIELDIPALNFNMLADYLKKFPGGKK